MNILYMYPSIDPVKGGMERVTYLLIQFFKACGHNAMCIGLRQDYREFEPDMNYFPNKKREDCIENKKYLADFVISNNIDVVICQTGGPGTSCKLLYSLPDSIIKIVCLHLDILDTIRHIGAKYSSTFCRYYVPFLSNFVELKPINKILQYYYRFKRGHLFNELYKNCDRVVLLSNSFKKDFAFMVENEELPNVISISNPLPPDFVKDQIKSVEEKSKTLLYVGRLNTTQKKVDYLLKIWALLQHKYPDWNLKIVGGGKEEDSIKLLAKKLNLVNYSFEGFKNPIDYYNDASILCMTSSYEGFGMVLIESMSFGTIPVAFNSYSSVMDIIEDEKTGFLVEPFNLNEYAQKIEFLIKSVEIRKKLYTNCLLKAKEFDIEIIGNKWLDLFNQIKKEKERK